MKMHIRILCIFVLWGYVQARNIRGTAFYCRDPDTGKFHSANSTWLSTTFCGNYTCKLRRRNANHTELTPLRSINITQIGRKDDTDIDNQPAGSVRVETRVKPEVLPLSNKDRESISENFDRQSGTTDDRYLTEAEIKSITDILHTVKKSDLDAIVEIYNLAQDIYKEMDKATSENLLDETINSIKKQVNCNEAKPVSNRHISYWYDPLQNINNNRNKKLDLAQEGTTNSKTYDRSNSYFNGALNNNDFGKLPYYYPIPNFQRMTPYINPVVYNPGAKTKPCNTPNTFIKSKEPEKSLEPLLIPYPFSYVNYNMSYPNNLYYPWTKLDYNNENPSVQGTYFIKSPKKALLNNPHTEHDFVNVDSKPLLINKLAHKKEVRSDWQTDPISADILEEVRAKVQEKSTIIKSFPLRKRVVLEKVGKVIKYDDLERGKRETREMEPEEEDYETYLEKTTCEQFVDNRPGFFRVGDMSQPFPECCPQRIKKR